MLLKICQFLHDLSISTTVRESLWVFPTLEWIHIYSMIFLISVIAAFDLRLMGLAVGRGPRQPLSDLLRRVLRWALASFAVNFVTGSLLFMSKAPDYYMNSAFRIKILLIFVGILYHYSLLPRLKWQEQNPHVSLGAKAAGAFSLALWVGVIAASRWIAFV